LKRPWRSWIDRRCYSGQSWKRRRICTTRRQK